MYDVYSDISHLISVRLHVDRPLMCVPIFFSLFAKVPGNVSKHNGLHNSYSLCMQNDTEENITFKKKIQAQSKRLYVNIPHS